MSEIDESTDDGEPTVPIPAPPTANPARVRVPPEGPGSTTDEVGPAEPAPAEEV